MNAPTLARLLALPFLCAVLAAAVLAAGKKAATPPAPPPTPGDAALAGYFAAETSALESACLANLGTREAWEKQRETWRAQLRDMLGLSPWPERTELKATVTGRVDHPEFVVENVHFQSSPGLYVTANLYLPKGLSKPAPAILYVCGHASVKVDGVSMGNKTGYQHHGAWFARNGYVCLAIDTIQLGEIEGAHHGTYRMNQWWWNARGYTPAGVEAWNGIRALDYLQSRPEVDGARIGMTGRSGGGAYSWWVAALDDRVKVAVPVAGITDLRNHVVDGVVQGHCDCMFMVNTYRWDYPQVAALLAPRPLLLSNSDKDKIFPLDGVLRVHEKVRRVYRLLGAEENLGLLITEGPHKDTQDLQVPAFRWFDRFLKQEDRLVEKAATKLFQPAQLRVFSKIPSDERVTRIQETFVPTAVVSTARNPEEWVRLRDGWLKTLRERSFRGWPEVRPESVPELNAQMLEKGTVSGTDLYVAEFTSQEQVRLRVYGLGARAGQIRRLIVRLLDEASFPVWVEAVSGVFKEMLGAEKELLAKSDRKADPEAVRLMREEIAATLKAGESGLCYFAPRGLGADTWSATDKNRIHLLRRFNLLGQTVDGMRVWDVRRMVSAIRLFDAVRDLPIELEASGNMAVNALYASLFIDNVEELRLERLPASHRKGPDYLNVLRHLDIPQALAMAVERSRVRLSGAEDEAGRYAADTIRKLGWNEERLALE